MENDTNDQSLFTEATKHISKKLVEKRESAFQHFPLLFTLLGTFGLVATLYGFEGVLNRIPWFVDNPVTTLISGIGILAFTGTLYKKLGS